MNKMIDLLRCLLIATLIYNAAITTALFCINSKRSDITKSTKEQTVCNKELAYTVVCIGKKPCSYYSVTKWFTVDKEYTVYKLDDESYPLIYDDDGEDWCVFQYDKLMLEAGGYLFGRAKKVNDDEKLNLVMAGVNAVSGNTMEVAPSGTGGKRSMRIVTCDCCGQRMDRWVTITPELESVDGFFDDTFCYTTYTARKELCETCFKQFITQIEERRKEQ